MTPASTLQSPSPRRMLSLRSINDPPPIPSPVAHFFDALEQLPAHELVAISECRVTNIKHAAAECTRAAFEHGLRDPMDGAELAACRWHDRRMQRLHALEEDGRVAELTREVAGRVQVLAQWVATAIVVRNVVPLEVYQLATAPVYGLIPVPEPTR